jgi:hypothetical protein
LTENPNEVSNYPPDIFKRMDIYYIAVTINELITREQPFGPDFDFGQVRMNVLNGGRPRGLDTCPYNNASRQDLNLFKKLTWAVKIGWNQEWKQRPSAETLLREL